MFLDHPIPYGNTVCTDIPGKPPGNARQHFPESLQIEGGLIFIAGATCWQYVSSRIRIKSCCFILILVISQAIHMIDVKSLKQNFTATISATATGFIVNLLSFSFCQSSSHKHPPTTIRLTELKPPIITKQTSHNTYIVPPLMLHSFLCLMYQKRNLQQFLFLQNYMPGVDT